MNATQAWRPNYWYEEDVEVSWKIPSNKLERSFTKVADLYLKHQTTWDSADEVEEVEDDQAEQVDSDEEEEEVERLNARQW